jgi:hypothetical protein
MLWIPELSQGLTRCSGSRVSQGLTRCSGSQSLAGSDEMLRFPESRSKRHPRHPRTVLTRSRILGDLQEVVSTPDAAPFFMVIFR